MKIPTQVTRLVGRTVLQTKAKSPTLLFASGVVGVVGTVVLASRATLKLDRLIDDWAKEKQMLHEDSEVSKNDLLFFYARSAKELVVLYAPAVAVGTASVAALTGSHVILTKRNVAITAAYAGLEQSFKEYRERVAKDLGEDKEAELHYGSDIVKLDKSGKISEIVPGVALKNSMYARFFDETSPSWNRRQDYNMIFLEMQQTYFNNMLHSRGHVFLNEVYDRLGIERTQAGQVMGWIVTKDRSTDEYVDFGIFNAGDDRKRAFVNGFESAILLDFNVTNVLDKL